MINGRLLGIQIPDYIMRQQRNIEDFKHWKGKESLKNPLLSPICVAKPIFLKDTGRYRYTVELLCVELQLVDFLNVSK